MAKHTFFCVDAHTCGNPVRVITGGGPQLDGATMSERRQHFLAEYDWVRTGLMFEPRGHDMMSGTILYPSTREDCDVGVLFIETSGCLPMCGHGTIGTVTVIIEQGLVKPREAGKLVLEVPAGVVKAHYTMDGDRVSSVRIVNVPSFLYEEDLEVACPRLGSLRVDVAYGGNFYAIVEPQENFSDMGDFPVADLITMSPGLRKALNERYRFIHPEDERIQGLSHILWTGKPLKGDADARNGVFYGDKAIDRSPCGTGTSARMAQWARRGNLKMGETFVHESVIGSKFVGRIEAHTRVGDYKAIIPSIEGWARLTGYNTIFIDENDPYAHGFQVL